MRSRLTAWPLSAVRRGDRICGAIVRLQRVAPVPYARFDPLRAGIVTPEFLDRMLRALRRWNYDLVSMDEVPHRLAAPVSGRKFVAITFDGGSRDILDHARPVLWRHGAPFAVYVPTSQPDGLAVLGMEALAQIVREQVRIGLLIGQEQRHLACASIAEKRAAFAVLAHALRAQPTLEAATAMIRDLAARYGIDLPTLTRARCLDWQGLHQLAAGTDVVIGAATVSGFALSKLAAAPAAREIRMGASVLEASLGPRPAHFAFPGGLQEHVLRRDIRMAAELGFATAVTAEHRPLRTSDAGRLHALPRLSIDGRRASLLYLRATLAGWNATPWPTERIDTGALPGEVVIDPAATSS